MQDDVESDAAGKGAPGRDVEYLGCATGPAQAREREAQTSSQALARMLFTFGSLGSMSFCTFLSGVLVF